ncbi:kelch repeat-containing protein [Echria macrotheca]|uniref:Kelch repeat-containing protein n=1 Tax=Echria macrotheca TaxID=438768 RepID=A0AAJ0B986_9PEZI|nr:kelch repeat-containing protein [Echria macrotheca]
MGRYMPFLSLLVILLNLSPRIQGSEHHALAARDDAPSTTDFLRRAFPAVIVLGDYLYIDGGEVAQLYGGKNGSAEHPSYAMNGTLSIPLKTSWTNSTVTFKQSPKAAPVFNQQGIWRDPAGSAFYIWGGTTSYFAQPPPLEIWRFSADGYGGGGWAHENPRGNAVVELAKATRGGQASFTQSREIGYYLGGYASAQTDTSVTGDAYLALPGLIEFNMTSGELTNASSVGLGPYSTLIKGAAEFVPFGPGGVLLFLGGGQSSIRTTYGGWTGVDFNNLTLYDINAKKWYSQQTTGARPTRRERFCTVGVAGPNNTYEIFMYGGVDTQASRTSDEVYVLSLPGFVFFKGPTASTARADHSCALVGRSQMLSIGGTDAFAGFPNSLLDRDPWQNGLGILDLPPMAWKNSYDADAAPYDSPVIVKQWYSQGGLGSVAWSSPEVEKLFAETAPPSADPNPTSPSGPNQPTSSNPSDSSNNNASSGPPVGAIVGGVLGGVVLVVVVVGLFIVHRHKKRQRDLDPALGETQPVPPYGYSKTWDPHKAEYVERWSSAVTSEPPPQELEGHTRQELPAGHGYSEMHSPHGTSELPPGARRDQT